jgi:hypothetical protein
MVGMFQPWTPKAYGFVFFVLFVPSLSFVVWSHVEPKRQELEE